MFNSTSLDLGKVLDRGLNPCIVIDAAGFICLWNKAATSYFGWTDIDIKDRAIVDVLIPQRGLWEYVKNDGDNFQSIAAIHKDLHEFPIDVRIDAVGTYLVIFVKNTNDLKYYKDQYKHLQNVFTKVVNEVSDYAIYFLNIDGLITSWNLGARLIKGYTEEEVLGKHFRMFYTYDYLENNIPEKELEVARIRGRVENEGWRLRKDGTKFWAKTVITSVIDSDCTLQGYLKIVTDITSEENIDVRAKLQDISLELDKLRNKIDDRLKEN